MASERRRARLKIEEQATPPRLLPARANHGQLAFHGLRQGYPPSTHAIGSQCPLARRVLTVEAGIEPFAAEAEAVLKLLEDHRSRELVAVPAILSAPATSSTKLPVHGPDAAALRQALIEERKLAIVYTDRKAQTTKRTIWPLEAADFGPNGAMLAWCEKRKDFRNFRFDRITAITLLPERMPALRAVLSAFAAIKIERSDSEW